jgi:NAD(P)-dependent dehydrogenase (short-subunit alcohol dehydrogenase family)
MAGVRRPRQARWTAEQVPSQRGRTFVVTGGAGGLGLELSRALATAGAHVVLGVRNPDKGNAAAERIRATGAPGPVEVRRLDVSDLDSVREFAAGLPGVDVLVNNAGVMAIPRATSVDGFELQLATNHLGHFALANLLLPKLTDRVVAVASAAHRAGVLDVDDLDMDRRGYVPYAAYAQSKLANLLFVAELQRRLTAAGSRLRATAGHPGWTATGIQGGTGNQLFTRLSDVGNTLFGMKPSQGALPVLYAATMDIPGNSYVGPGGFRELFGWPALVGRTPAASDPDLAKALWARSEELTGVLFPW